MTRATRSGVRIVASQAANRARYAVSPSPVAAVAYASARAGGPPSAATSSHIVAGRTDPAACRWSSTFGTRRNRSGAGIDELSRGRHAIGHDSIGIEVHQVPVVHEPTAVHIDGDDVRPARGVDEVGHGI